MKQLVLNIASRPAPSLTNFVPGRNVELVQALENIATGSARERFVYLWGGTGCGRTHLLQAIVAKCASNRRSAAYFSCDPRTSFDPDAATDCVAVDDIDRLNPNAQIDLFNLYNRMRDEGRAVLAVSGPTAPAYLKLREDLVTRLGWELVYQVHELTDEEKIEAMLNHATGRGLKLPESVCGYLLRHARRDLPSLMAMLDALDNYALMNRRKITIPLVRELIHDAPG